MSAGFPAADPQVRSFAELGVEEDLCRALGDVGIAAPFPIQELTLPLALSGADLIGQARTGTGKTLAFGIPLLQRIDPASRRTQALVVVPTRELCLQVRNDLDDAGARKGVSVVATYGGKAIEAQSRAIAEGAPVVVGTPGRLLDLQRRGALDLSTVTTLVLDEADEMLDLGFLPDVQQLIESCDPHRQTMLFSATMPSQVVALARRYMHKPTFLRADVEETSIAPETRQYFLSCHRMDKPAVLARILQTPRRGLCLVFTRTKRMADMLADELRGRGIAAAPIHSDLRQDARERALGRFRTGKVDVLVATEVAARGLDITDVTHVVNYDCPDDEKMYLHRIGRTGRAGAAGVAITLAVWNELARLEMIKRALGVEEQTYEVFSTSPILDALFDLPAGPPRPGTGVTPAPAEGGPGAEAGADREPGVRRRKSTRRRRSAAAASPTTASDDAVTGPAAAMPVDVGPQVEPSTPAYVAAAADTAIWGERPSPPDATALPAEAPDAAPPVGETSGRRRVRRRTRQGSVPTAAPPTGKRPERAAARGVPAEGAVQPAPAAPTPAVREGPAAEPPPAGRGRPAGRGASRTRRRPAREAGGRVARQPLPVREVDVAAARGLGRPMIRRPLVIAHLP